MTVRAEVRVGLMQVVVYAMVMGGFVGWLVAQWRC